MKISEMTNDQATEAMIRLSEPFKNICDDDDMVAILDKLKNLRDEVPVRAIGRMIPDICGYAMKKHRKDLYEIVGALAMIPTEKVGGMNFKQTIGIIRDSYDDILKDFFTSSVPTDGRNET